MIKFIVVFILGLLEQAGYTLYLLSVVKKQAYLSSILMFVYFSFYLFIIAYALKDTNTVGLLLTYAFSAAVGNFIVIKWELRKK
jgi:hypothetical protein